MKIPNVRGLVAGRSLIFPADGEIERWVDDAVVDRPRRLEPRERWMSLHHRAGSLSTSDDAVLIDPAKAGWSYCGLTVFDLGPGSDPSVAPGRGRGGADSVARVVLDRGSRLSIRSFGTGHRSSSPCPTLAICLSMNTSRSSRRPEDAWPWRPSVATERSAARFYPAGDVDGGGPGCGPGDPSDQSDPVCLRRRSAATDRCRGAGARRQLVVLPTSQARRMVGERGPASRRSTTSRSGRRLRRRFRVCIAPTPPTARSTRRSKSASGDVFLVPRGYHGPCVAAPGYDMYYLNVMAGPDPERRWMISTDPAYAWLWEEWKTVPPDPRVPLYR